MMSLKNDKNISQDLNKNQIQYDEINLIESNPIKLENKESSRVEISLTDKSSKKTVNVSSDIVFGSSINICNPRKIGSVQAFFYIKGFPIIIFGPDCKL